ncbi:MAG: hypothetical protein HUJ31_01360 [Pseudomonadales bacterium]|nr:hypothetical protein [Pseudomonadales bacterium]
MSKDNDPLPPRDEEIQALLDNQVEPAAEDPDVRAYRRVFQALESSSARLPASFSDQVLRRILARQAAVNETNALVISTVLSIMAGLAGLGSVMLLTRLGYISPTLEIGLLIDLLTSTGVILTVVPVMMLMALDGLLHRRPG